MKINPDTLRRRCDLLDRLIKRAWESGQSSKAEERLGMLMNVRYWLQGAVAAAPFSMTGETLRDAAKIETQRADFERFSAKGIAHRRAAHYLQRLAGIDKRITS